jgi:hypothetical protein
VAITTRAALQGKRRQRLLLLIEERHVASGLRGSTRPATPAGRGRPRATTGIRR